ncbi:MAG: sulfatase [Bacteroidetes bacterium]|nr:MAG: sulfatase [Bacteroidota bacterium]
MKYRLWPRGLYVLGTLAGLGYLLWPLGSAQFAIHYDQQEAARTRAFLAERQPLPQASRPPNIVILMADDLGFSDISLHGNKQVHTPHIDALAAQGVNCRQAYATAPVCAPSRAGFITGRYQHRFGFENQMQQRYLRNRLEYYGYRLFVNSYPWHIRKMDAVPRQQDIRRQGLPPTEITLGELFQKYGYRTAITGKWHLGSAPYQQPHHRGFDYHYGFYSSHTLYAPEGTAGIIDTHNPRDWTDQHIWAGQRQGDHAIVRNGQQVQETDYLTSCITREAIAFMRQQQHAPFLLYVPFSTPHTPFQVPADLYERFAHISDPVKRTYYAMITSLDEAVGAIHGEIVNLGLEEHTLIFFLSDNGGAAYTFATDNAPLKGGKITPFEGGLRVPFMAKWKDVLPAQLEYPSMVSAMDVFVTACAAAGIPLPPGREYDGVNLLPYWLGERQEAPHAALFWKAGADRIVIKDGWKLLFKEHSDEQSLLYYLKEDPYEQRSLTQAFPQRVQALRQLHFQWSADFPAPLWPPLVQFEFRQGGQRFLFDI